MTNSLKGVCQHCGNIYLSENEATHEWTVFCDCGFAHRAVGWHKTKREAVKAWNLVWDEW